MAENIEVFVYVAAPWEDKEIAREAAEKLKAAGITITSRWIDLHKDTDKDLDENFEFLAEQAMHDLQDVYQSDILVLLNTKKSEGKAVETGLAVAWRKPVIMVGKRTNIFHWLPITVVETVEDTIPLIKQWIKQFSTPVSVQTEGTIEDTTTPTEANSDSSNDVLPS